MKLYPAIDLKDGACVRLIQGDYNQLTCYNSVPEEVARKWEELGGDFLHVVDLDGAKQGESVNDEVVKRILEVVKMPVEIGGGIRSLETIEQKLKMGVTRVILGSSAIKQKSLVEEAIKKFGKEKVVVGVDAKGGKVAIEGWLEITDISALSFCKELEKIGVETVIYTDIAKDGMMQGPNIEETQKVVEQTNLKVVASGGVSSLEDLKKLQAIGVEGAIIGKALYTNAIALEEAATLFH